MTPATDVHSDDEEVEIPSSSTKHTAGGPLPGECLKAQKMDDDPVPMPKVKASRTEDNVNQVAEIDMCHNILKTMRWKLILKMNALLVMGKVMVHPMSVQRSYRSLKKRQHLTRLRSCIRWR